MDAFVIRGMLVPAVMKLAGDASWWAPKWMRKRSAPPPLDDRFPPDPSFVAKEADPLVPAL
jgi:RND superfamily putative drug exporter